jgi:hypothetical protein
MVRQIFGDVPVGYPRCDDRGHAIAIKQAIDLEDVRAHHVFPHDYLPAKALCLIESARVRASRFPPTPVFTFVSFVAFSWSEVFTATGSSFRIPQ